MCMPGGSHLLTLKWLDQSYYIYMQLSWCPRFFSRGMAFLEWARKGSKEIKGLWHLEYIILPMAYRHGHTRQRSLLSQIKAWLLSAETIGKPNQPFTVSNENHCQDFQYNIFRYTFPLDPCHHKLKPLDYIRYIDSHESKWRTCGIK